MAFAAQWREEGIKERACMIQAPGWGKRNGEEVPWGTWENFRGLKWELSQIAVVD